MTGHRPRIQRPLDVASADHLFDGGYHNLGASGTAAYIAFLKSEGAKPIFEQQGFVRLP